MACYLYPFFSIKEYKNEPFFCFKKRTFSLGEIGGHFRWDLTVI